MDRDGVLRRLFQTLTFEKRREGASMTAGAGGWAAPTFEDFGQAQNAFASKTLARGYCSGVRCRKSLLRAQFQYMSCASGTTAGFAAVLSKKGSPKMRILVAVVLSLGIVGYASAEQSVPARAHTGSAIKKQQLPAHHPLRKRPAAHPTRHSPDAHPTHKRPADHPTRHLPAHHPLRN